MSSQTPSDGTGRAGVRPPRWRLLCWIFAGAFSQLQAAPGQPELRFLTLEYPPYSSPKLADGGAMEWVLRAALEPRGYVVHIRSVPWARVSREIAQGDTDGVMLLWPTEVTELRLLPTRPVFVSRLGFFVRREHWQAQDVNWQILKGQAVGVVRGYTYPDQLRNTGAVLEEAISDWNNLKKLAAKRFDYVALERATGEYQLAREAEGTLAPKIVWQAPALVSIPLTFGLVPGRPGAQALLTEFELALQQLRGQPAFAAMLKRFHVEAALAEPAQSLRPGVKPR